MPATGYTKRTAKWTEQECIDAAHRWQEAFGAPPAAADWNPSDARRNARTSLARAQHWAGRVARFESGEWPWTGTVWKLFGGWNAFIAAAGFTPRTSERVSFSEAPQSTRELVPMLQTIVSLDSGPSRKVALIELAEAAIQLAQLEPEE
jgi:hypothetical protein